MKRTSIVILAALMLVAALLVTGCNKDRTQISSILQTPNKFMNKEVLVGGNVTKVYAVNLVLAEAGAYQVDDGTGKIWVITRTGVPAQGSQVGLKGTVAGGLNIGREVFGAVIREQERRTR